MLRKSVLLAFGLSFSFSGLAVAASGELTPEQQVQPVEGARKINPAAVEVLLGKNHRMTFDFYGDNVFRIFRDDKEVSRSGCGYRWYLGLWRFTISRGFLLKLCHFVERRNAS